MRTILVAAPLLLLAVAPMAGEDCMDDWFGDPCPIVINFTGGYALTGSESPVLFDILGTGEPLLIGWTAAGSDEAFLCLDRDRSGSIDSGAELFGNAVLLADGRRASNGFVALSTFDDNTDSRIDAADPIWAQLRLWRDVDHDGISQASELSPIEGSGVKAIGLDHRPSGRRDVAGNTLRYQGEVWLDGPGGTAVPRPLYDIFFVAVR